MKTLQIYILAGLCATAISELGTCPWSTMRSWYRVVAISVVLLWICMVVDCICDAIREGK